MPVIGAFLFAPFVVKSTLEFILRLNLKCFSVYLQTLDHILIFIISLIINFIIKIRIQIYNM
jgi:hypothetical protein